MVSHLSKGRGIMTKRKQQSKSKTQKKSHPSSKENLNFFSDSTKKTAYFDKEEEFEKPSKTKKNLKDSKNDLTFSDEIF